MKGIFTIHRDQDHKNLPLTDWDQDHNHLTQNSGIAKDIEQRFIYMMNCISKHIK